MTNPIDVDLFISARWIIPVVPRGRIFEDCTLVIDKGEILAIGIQHELEQQYRAGKSIQLPHHALVPGLINAHGHAAMTLMRGFADDKPLMEWLEQHIWPAEQTWVSEKFVADGSRLAIAEMIASGTTCFSDMYFFPEETAAAAIDAGIRAQISFPILDFPTAWANSADEYLRKGIALHDQYRAHELINVCFGPHAPYTVSDEPLRKIATYAPELQTPVQIHLHETADEVSNSLDQSGQRPIERLNSLGLLSPLTQCVHMTQIEDSDIKILKQTGAHVIHCPSSNLKLASGHCPADQLLKAGVNVAIGTDGAASNNVLDMMAETRLAALIGKMVADDATAIDATTALEMATINGAKALGMENRIGSIEVGKSADIAAFDLSGIAQQPVYDPISQLIYTNVGAKASHVWVQGKALLENAQLTTLDTKALIENAQSWQEKLSPNASQ